MLILAIDTTMAARSLALVKGTADRPEVLFQQQTDMRHGQAESLLPAIGDALKQTGHEPKDITAVAAATGPGAFTGIRVGLAAARGFALALNCPGLGIDGFSLYRAMALNAGMTGQAPLLIAIDSRRAEHYLQAHINGRIVEASLPLTAIDDWLAGLGATDHGWNLLGDISDQVSRHVIKTPVAASRQTMLDPGLLAVMAMARLDRAGEYPLNPSYHRPADAMPAKPTRVWLADQG